MSPKYRYRIPARSRGALVARSAAAAAADTHAFSPAPPPACSPADSSGARPCGPAAPRRQSGVSLIELIIAIVILTLAAVLATSALIPAAQSIAADEYIQTATRYAQDCTAHILMRRRVQSGGWNNVALGSPSTICNSLALDSSNYTRTVNVTDPPVPSPPCPTAGGSVCKLVQVTVTHTDSGYSADVRFMLVNY